MTHKIFLFTISLIFSISLATSQTSVNKLASGEKESGGLLFLDAHTHVGFGMTSTGIVLNTGFLEQRNMGAFVFALPVDLSKTNNLVERISSEMEQIKKICAASDKISITKSAFDVGYNFKMGKMSALFSIEYYNGVFGGDLSTIDKYAALGIQYITLIDNQMDDLYTNATGGVVLTEFGKSVIDKLNEVGIIIDVRHISDKAIVAVAEYSQKPIISSHSHARGVTKLNFNISDEAMEAIKENNGKIFISFNKDGLFYANESKDFGIERLVSHIDYVKNKIGIDNVGIGTDLQANGRYISRDFKSVDCVAAFTNSLKKRGYTALDIEKVLGKNYLSLLKQF